MKTIVRFSAVLALVAFVGCSENQQPLAPQAVDLTKNGSAMSLNKTTSFKVSVSGEIANTGEATYELTGGGHASHLGNITYSGITHNALPTTNGISDDLTETLTDAKGNQLIIQCHQDAVQISPGVYESTDDSWTVTGGTGRFSGATGSGSGTTHVDLNANTFTKTCSGTITY